MSKSILLNGDALTRKDVINVAVSNYQVEVDISKLSASLNYINEKVKNEKIVYGVTTGFGSNTNKMIQKEDAIDLQLNLLRSHACGVGKPLSREIVRAIMVIRLNTLLKGYSGVQESTVNQLAFLINNQIHPVIPEKGSVGASGDLCPLSHMALPLLGEGEIEYKGTTYRTEDFMESEDAKAIGYRPITLGYKEGLALNNGTTVIAAVATIALAKADNLIKVATLSTALIYESLCARDSAFRFDPVHQIRKHSGQIEIAQWLKTLLEGSKLVGITQKEIIELLLQNAKIPADVRLQLEQLNTNVEHDEQVQISNKLIFKLRSEGYDDLAYILQFARLKWKPQDSYSIRCVPQVFGASKVAIDHASDIIENELNAACDNPLIFADEDRVVSGGNFHGQPVALVMDYLKLAVAEIGNITERQLNKMVDRNTNDGLPPFLIDGTGLNSGLMVTQYAAASIVSENKVLVHPASADSVPTCENTEDHVSMGTIAARQAIEIAENVEDIVVFAIMAGYYAIHLRMRQFEKVNLESSLEGMLAPSMVELCKTIRNSNKAYQKEDFFETDRFIAPETRAVKSSWSEFVELAERYLG